MAKGTKFTVTLPNGETFARTSETKTYAFAIVILPGTESGATHYVAEDGAGVWGWSGRLDLAEKTANQARKVYGDRVRVIPVD
jgi:hypothetical protein